MRRCRSCYFPCPRCGYSRERETVALVAEAEARANAVQAAIERVALKHGVTVEALQSGRRYGFLVAARDELIRELREDVGLQLTEIAFILKRHHTSIIHSLKKQEVARARMRVV